MTLSCNPFSDSSFHSPHTVDFIRLPADVGPAITGIVILPVQGGQVLDFVATDRRGIV
jgi:hypothetical protein